MSAESSRCGTSAIVGRPNVGKSTLLNRLLGQKISITSRKPQTTRNQILGVVTEGDDQLIFVDTPGWQTQPRGKMNRLMNRQVQHALDDVNVAVMLIDARSWTQEDEPIFDLIESLSVPTALVLNKVDRLHEKKQLLPFLAELSAARPQFKAFFPISARTGGGLRPLVEFLIEQMPFGPHVFPADQVTDRTERFLSAEIIREKTLRYLGDELPYRTGVVIENFEEQGDCTRIAATVWVERESQKAIVIGKGGEMLKKIASEARRDIEALVGERVFLQVWVKAKRGWTDNPEALTVVGLSE